MLPKIPDITHLKELSAVLTEERFPIVSLDTSFVLKALVEGLGYHEQCVQFIKDLRTIQPIIVFSELLRSELWCANLRIKISNIYQVKPSQATDIIKKYPKLPRQLSRHSKEINRCFDELLGGFTYWHAIPVDNKITAKALDLLNKYNLLGADAIHIASMLHNDFEAVKHIVAFDDDIENITDLTVWTVEGKRRYIRHHYKEWGFKNCPVVPI